MTHDEFNAFCAGLPATSYVMQWRGSHVWKVGGVDEKDRKVFAIGLRVDGRPAYTFKTSEIAYEMLRDHPGCRPAPHFASRGMKWIQCIVQPPGDPGLPDDALVDYLRDSHRLASLNLPKGTRRALGLGET
jgi:predicted DNA-binding protein (MmcQ/YjbR family)